MVQIMHAPTHSLPEMTTAERKQIDESQATKLYKLSAEQNYVPAQYLLGMRYLRAKLVSGKKDPEILEVIQLTPGRALCYHKKYPNNVAM